MSAAARRPNDLNPPPPSDAPDVAAYFEALAYFEEASVDAFDALRSELEVHGAPRPLVAAAARASDDERMHARIARTLAMRFGGRPSLPPAAPRGARTLEEIALENATLGCIRGSYGAAVVRVQAVRASDPVVRAAMKRLAPEEARHAELAWAVHGWLCARTGPLVRDALITAQRDELVVLGEELMFEHDAVLIDVIGLPTANQARALVARLVQERRIAA